MPRFQPSLLRTALILVERYRTATTLVDHTATHGSPTPRRRGTGTGAFSPPKETPVGGAFQPDALPESGWKARPTFLRASYLAPARRQDAPLGPYHESRGEDGVKRTDGHAFPGAPRRCGSGRAAGRDPARRVATSPEIDTSAGADASL